MAKRICSVEGCDRVHESHGMCHRCRGRYRAAHPDKPCGVEDCGKQSVSHGFCPAHLRKFKLYGDPLAPNRKRAWPPFEHGTPHGYGYHKCRCMECKAWAVGAQTAYIERRKNDGRWNHGIIGYQCGCRCEICVETARSTARRFYRNNPERGARINAARRAAKLAIDCYEISERDWERLCQRYDQCCAYCGKRKKLTRDHIIPVTRGGQESIGNLVPACDTCNKSKNDKLLVEWRYGRKRPARRKAS